MSRPPPQQNPPASAPGLGEDAAWYEAGLRFTCTQCGHCCTGDPGFTWVSPQELAVLALRSGVDEAAFRRRYTRTVWRDGKARVSLLEKRGGDCVFYTQGVGCTVYEDRPKQCRTWPFWQRVVDSPEDWHAAGSGCPGIGTGTLHGAETISHTAADDGLG